MSVRAVAVVLLLVAAPPAGASQPFQGHRLQAVPEDAAETSLRDALAKGAFAGPAATIEALRAVSAAHLGTPVAGLAQLAAGLTALDAGRPADAIPLLRQPDIQRTAIGDRALGFLGQALEAAGDVAGAGPVYLAAADARPQSPAVCTALFRGADTLAKAGREDRAVEALGRTLEACPDQQARALLRMAEIQDARRDPRGAAQAYDRLDREFPASPEARQGASRLKALARHLPPVPAPERTARDIRKALAIFDADRHAEASVLLRSLQSRALTPEQADLVRIRRGRALLQLGGTKAARTELAGVKAGSPHEGEAAFYLAKLETRRTGSAAAFEAVAERFAGTPWGEEALFALANHYQKDALDDDALPYYRRLLEGNAEGRFANRAAWRVAWGDFRAGRFEDAARVLETAALLRPSTSYTAGFLYWAARARRELGQSDRARQLFEETVRRFKHTYHGMKAQEALAQLPPAPPSTPPVMRAAGADPAADVPEPQLTRVRQLLLIDRFDEALEELGTVPPSPGSQATIAWIVWRRGRLRPAITAMKRAFPGHLGEAGDSLPEEVWKILYPIDYRDALQARATREGLDPALVAALICQESTFNPGAVSGAGARGLMQVIPPTGRTLARSFGVRFRKSALYDPEVSLDYGTRYLRQMLDRFEGRVERALAAYNAGPHRVEAWTAGRREMSAEEFIESIPFSETRQYVMTILAGREQYRRLYAFPPAHSGAASADAARP